MQATNALIAYSPFEASRVSLLAESVGAVAEVVLSEGQGLGAAIREGISRLTQPTTLLLLPNVKLTAEDLRALTRPIEEGTADIVFAHDASSHPPALSAWTKWLSDTKLQTPFQGAAAFRTDVLKSLKLTAHEDDIWVEILAKASANLYRMTEVSVSPHSLPHLPLRTQFRVAKGLFEYTLHPEKADVTHEGHTTLAHLEGGAPNYNTWLGQRFREYCGKRVLEIGAGIGTITAQLEQGRELLIALEVEDFYVERLKNRFKGKPHVRPYLSDVALADWESLRKVNLDSIVLSNVLEHIPDDAAALQRFRQVLPSGGRLLVLVPALPQLFGSMDEAVGHHRRYTKEGLEALLESNGFTVEKLEWMNVVGIPGWYVNGRLFKRRAVPPLQLRMYDMLAPWLARAEAHVKLPVGMSLFAVARANSHSPL